LSDGFEAVTQTKCLRYSGKLPNNAFQACTATLENITAKLRHIEATSPEIALQAPDTLNLLALEQLLDQWQTEADRVIQLIQSSQQEEGNRVVVPIILAQSSLSNLCPNGILYRNNQCSFDQVAVSCHRAGSIQEWACRLCSAIVSRASMPLSLAKSGSAQVYITPVGFFKGHGARHEAGTWSCIWEKRLKECSDSFYRKRDLLRHMQAIHVKSQRNIGMFDVDFPADGRELNPAKCGYGVSITGDEMRIGKGRFIVP
jgi:hypothetical protein